MSFMIFLIGFVVGSFIDLNLSKAIYDKNNTFGLIISILGTIPGYGSITLLGGIFLYTGLKRNDFKLFIRILFIILAIAAFITATYYSGREIFGVNGFYNSKLKFIGYIISAPIMCLFGFGGYFIALKSNNKYLWLLTVIIVIAFFIILVPGTSLLKIIFNRPRYRTVSLDEAENVGIIFKNWWQRTGNYKDLITTFNNTNTISITSEEFKSFPSGHVSSAFLFSSLALFLPIMDKKYEKISLPLFCGGLIWTLLVGFARIRVGAHFLSDVSMGGMLAVIFSFIANEVIMRLKYFKQEIGE